MCYCAELPCVTVLSYATLCYCYCVTICYCAELPCVTTVLNEPATVSLVSHQYYVASREGNREGRVSGVIRDITTLVDPG